MRRFILTGAPGSGKTAILRQLQLDGFSVIEEAATDIVAAGLAQGSQPWTDPSFIDTIARLQKDRQLQAQSTDIQFHDRSPVCTAALATHLGYPISPFLAAELQRIQQEAIYQPQVFFIRNLGFVTPTEVRRITLEDTLRFEQIHEQTYRALGFQLIFIDPAPVAARVAAIKATLPAPERYNPMR
ncbi:MAG TPA: AAA family ATPase [Bryobacteraceae bacterium]